MCRRRRRRSSRSQLGALVARAAAAWLSCTCWLTACLPPLPTCAIALLQDKAADKEKKERRRRDTSREGERAGDRPADRPEAGGAEEPDTKRRRRDDSSDDSSSGGSSDEESYKQRKAAKLAKKVAAHLTKHKVRARGRGGGRSVWWLTHGQKVAAAAATLRARVPALPECSSLVCRTRAMAHS